MKTSETRDVRMMYVCETCDRHYPFVARAFECEASHAHPYADEGLVRLDDDPDGEITLHFPDWHEMSECSVEWEGPGWYGVHPDDAELEYGTPRLISVYRIAIFWEYRVAEATERRKNLLGFIERNP